MAEPTASIWQISLAATEGEAANFEDALEGVTFSVSRFKAPGAEGSEAHWRIEALCETKPDIARVAVLLAEAAGRSQTEIPDFHIEPIADRDWLALNRRQFPPVTAGRFFIHGSHFEGAPPDGATAITLDAGRAFGAGTHETTRGCLLALDALAAEGPLGATLDLGCGSGVLAIAIAKAAATSVVACDNDPAAVTTARANALANGVGDLVTVIEGDGATAPEVRAQGPYDLIVANILAEPLIEMVDDIANALGPVPGRDQRVVLSGLLSSQEGEVAAAYEAKGLARRRVIVLGEWSTLVLVRRSKAA
jgi:ribosomal protein L11 methyltransferase